MEALSKLARGKAARRFERKQQAHVGAKILFVAGFQHAPNVDAASWLVASVMPLVWRTRPDAQLFLVGSKPTQGVMNLAIPGKIEVTGGVSVDVLAGHYANARVSVVPLRFGAGVKLKVLETMQSGVPLVTTSVGLQGLPDVRSTLVPMDEPQHMADDLIRLLGSDEAWLERSQAQTDYVSQHFSVENMRARFKDILSR